MRGFLVIKKKFIFLALSILFVVFVSLVFLELFLNFIPCIYRFFPLNDNVQYIYILGESTADGFPYEKISYSKILEYVVKDRKINDKKIKIIYLQKSGCQLYHQFISYFLYRYSHPFHRGIMLLYMGTNNWSKKPLYSDFKRNLLLKSIIYSLLEKYIRYLQFEKYEFDDKYDFQYEYEKIVLLAKKFNEDIYISTISGNYEFPPDSYNNHNENKEIDQMFFSGNLVQAQQLCNKYLEDNKYKDKSRFWYRLGMILKQENKIKDANEAFFNAVKYNFEDKPESIFQNYVIKKIASKYDIPVFDFFQQLCKSGKIIGFDFFVDTIHPNIETHIDITYGFVYLLSKKYEFDFIKKEDIDVEKLKNFLSFNNNDMARVIMSRIIEFKSRNDDTIKFNKDVYLKMIKELKEINVDGNLLPNRDYINKFLDFDKKYKSELYYSNENLREDLDKMLDVYAKQTFDSNYFNNVNKKN